jgi:hypothetical protein
MSSDGKLRFYFLYLKGNSAALARNALDRFHQLSKLTSWVKISEVILLPLGLCHQNSIGSVIILDKLHYHQV